MAFAGHVHVHDEFSPLDGSGNRNMLSCEAARHGQTHLGCTNHGRLGSALDHIDACRHPEKYDDPYDESKKRSSDERLIPVVGIEAFWRPDRFMELKDKNKYGKNPHNWANHLCCHAASYEGWRTLLRLSSKSWVRRENGGGFYGKPCFDWAMLEEDHEGIVVSTACLASPLSQFILAEDEDGAYGWVERMLGIVGPDNLFLEVMPHDLEEQRLVNIEKINIANEFGLPFMGTGDVHMPYKKWADTQQVVRMAAYRQTVSTEAKKEEAGEEIYTSKIDTVYLSSGKQMADMFREHHPDMDESLVDEALNNTEVFFRQCAKPYVISKNVKLPKATEDEDAETLLKRWLKEGRKKREGIWRAQGISDKEFARRKEAYRERINYEWRVLKEKGVLDYFVMVGDMVRWAKSDLPIPTRDSNGKLVYDGPRKQPIRVGLGRGSAAGCLVSYDIGITAVDPISWGLLFERFLNPDRIGLPDIDIDFQSDKRQMVKDYLGAKYGHDHVADVIAYQTFAPRAVIKAVATTQDYDNRQLAAVTDSIGDTERGLEKIATANPIVAEFKEKNEWIWEQCLRLEDQVVRDTKHASAILVTPKPVSEYMPTQLGTDEESVVTAFADRAEFPIISDYGFVKIDVLGVRSLEKMQMACEFIEEYYDEYFEPNDLAALVDPFNVEPDVIEGFVHGMTLGVFQFASRGITQLLRHIKPDNAMDVAVANALFRPGPIKIAFEYGDRKNGKTPVTYWHDAVEPILKETLGLMCFQEQAMEVCKQLGNFTGGEADAMRKAMSKLYRLPGDKAQEFMQGFYDTWMKGITANGLREEEGDDIWSSKMLPLGNYLFNKSHAGSYALQAVQDMHIKIKFPLAFYPALLTTEKKKNATETRNFLKGVMRESRVLGVELAPPDINKGEGRWTVERKQNKIRFGFNSITDFGQAASKVVMDARGDKPFASYREYIDRIPGEFGIGSSVALAKSGAFDSIEPRDFLLGWARQWPITTFRAKYTFECGCERRKTIKGDSKFDLKMKKRMTERTMVCTSHEKPIENIEPIDPWYYVARWMKDYEGEPKNFIKATPEEITESEFSALNVALSMGELISKYWDFIHERIWDEGEFDKLPAKPRKVKDKHGSNCACKECEASYCVIGGEIAAVKTIKTKNGQTMAFVDVAFGVNQWSATVFPYFYERWVNLMKEPTLFLMRGHKDDRGQFLPFDIQPIEVVAKAEGFDAEKAAA